MEIKQRIAALRAKMREKNIDIYLVPAGDYHQSEYVGDYFQARRFLSGFTGSAGTVIVTHEKAGLWTDGRYYLQAELQLANTGIDLYRGREPGVITPENFILEEMPEGGTLGFDGKVVSAKSGEAYAKLLQKKNARVDASNDLVGLIWADRPALPTAPVFLLEERFTGESAASKLTRLREAIQAENATVHIIAELTEIAWLFNIRGGDIACVPVPLAYAAITETRAVLFIDEQKLSDEIKAYLADLGVEILPYRQVYSFVADLDSGEKVLLDDNRLNYALYQSLPADAAKIEKRDPVILMKARKNDTEVANIRNAYIKDGIACTKFMYWLKTNAGKSPITEISAADTLLAFRNEQAGFLQPSFGTISAYREHAAMMHYSATEETNYALENADMLLVDSGGHYYEGSTDVTRTYVLGPVNDEIKAQFTAVVKGMISLSMAKFLQGCKGENLDILARLPLWEMGLDYKCGTGHGIGYLLSVHEGPAGIVWRSRGPGAELERGMALTNEPGVYIDGSHGIRIENQLIVREAEQNVFGQFMDFETVTLVPIDVDGLAPEQMTEAQRSFLNSYHKKVYETIAPQLTKEEQVWLKEYTKPI